MRRQVSVYWPWAVVALFATAAGALAVNGLVAEKEGPDGCPNSGASAHDVALMDASDRLPGSQSKQVSAAVRRLAWASGPDRRFSLFAVGGGTEEDLVQEFSGCNVANAPLKGGGTKEKGRAAFMADTEAFLEGLAKAQRPTTPLFEAVETLRHRRDVCEANTTLYIVSDLMNNGGFSHYPGSPNYRPPSADDLPERSDLGCRFAEVRLLFIQRPGMRALQTEALRKFWIADLSRVADSVTLEAL